jgi:hypothetical protein
LEREPFPFRITVCLPGLFQGYIHLLCAPINIVEALALQRTEHAKAEREYE